jgi:hypothetical protein
VSGVGYRTTPLASSLPLHPSLFLDATRISMMAALGLASAACSANGWMEGPGGQLQSVACRDPATEALVMHQRPNLREHHCLSRFFLPTHATKSAKSQVNKLRISLLAQLDRLFCGHNRLTSKQKTVSLASSVAQLLVNSDDIR